jgi:hypothetical protein
MSGDHPCARFTGFTRFTGFLSLLFFHISPHYCPIFPVIPEIQQIREARVVYLEQADHAPACARGGLAGVSPRSGETPGEPPSGARPCGGSCAGGGA